MGNSARYLFLFVSILPIGQSLAADIVIQSVNRSLTTTTNLGRIDEATTDLGTWEYEMDRFSPPYFAYADQVSNIDFGRIDIESHQRVGRSSDAPSPVRSGTSLDMIFQLNDQTEFELEWEWNVLVATLGTNSVFRVELVDLVSGDQIVWVQENVTYPLHHIDSDLISLPAGTYSFRATAGATALSNEIRLHEFDYRVSMTVVPMPSVVSASILCLLASQRRRR